MGLGFSNVIQAADTRLASILTDYRKIHKIWDLSKEPKPTLDKGYGILFGRMEETQGATRHFTSRGDLIVYITNFLNLYGDSQSKVVALYNDIETVIRSFRDGSRLDSSVIVDVSGYRLSESQIIEGTEHVLVEITFDTLFRESF